MATIDLQQDDSHLPLVETKAVESNYGRPPCQVRAYRAEDEPQVLNLLGRALPRWAGYVDRAAVWKWKHFQNPFGASHIFVAADGDRILGTIALMKWRFRRAGELFETIRAVDMATEPSLQRQGVGKAISAVATPFVDRSATDFTVNTPNANSLDLAQRGTRRFVGLLRTRARVNRPIKAMYTWCAGAFKDAPSREHPSMVKQSNSLPFSEWIARTGDELPRLFAADEARDAARFRTDRTAAYIHWRYAAPPHLQYSAIECRQQGRLIGCLVSLVERKDSLDRLVIEDLLLADESPQSFRAMRQSLAAAMRQDVTQCHFPEDVAQRLLGRWTLCGKGYQLLVRRVGERAGSELFDPANWHLSLGDLREI